MATLKIKDFFGEEVTLQPRLELYSVTDFMGKEMPGLAVVLGSAGQNPGGNRTVCSSYRVLRGIYQR